MNFRSFLRSFYGQPYFVPFSIILAGIIISGVLFFSLGYQFSRSVETLKLPVPEVSQADHRKGPFDAGVIVIEYMDYRCPHCADFHNTMQKVLKNTSDVAWVVRDFAIFGEGPAVASECIAKLSGEKKFWKFTDTLLANQGKIGRGYAEKLATEYGISEVSFSQCIRKEKMIQGVKKESREARAAGARGTPFIIVVNEKTGEWKRIPGALPYARMMSVIRSVEQ